MQNVHCGSQRAAEARSGRCTHGDSSVHSRADESHSIAACIEQATPQLLLLHPHIPKCSAMSVTVIWSCWVSIALPLSIRLEGEVQLHPRDPMTWWEMCHRLLAEEARAEQAGSGCEGQEKSRLGRGVSGCGTQPGLWGMWRVPHIPSSFSFVLTRDKI